MFGLMGLFRTKLRQGALYEWRALMPPFCGHAGVVAGKSFTAGQSTDSIDLEVRLSLTCTVIEDNLKDCAAWWLTRQ